jgi:PelA/Pel-15E family pectate lyase
MKVPSFFLSLSLWLAGASSCMAAGVADYLKKPEAWYRGDEAKTVAKNILSYQTDVGAWPKNTDTVKRPFTGNRKDLKPTFDNGATMDELRFLARMHQATRDALYQKSFQRGLGYIFIAQYPNGGWPQYYPLSTQYHRHITFNDGSMVRVMEFLREVSRNPVYAFVSDADRKKAATAFDKGIACILRCQIRIEGKLTVWCAQHDEVTLEPCTARSYELPSLSGSESVGITRLLMSLEKPSAEVIAAVEAAVAWFEKSAQRGISIDTINDPKAPGGKDKVVVKDPKARPLWARFYDLKTQQPFFCDRDGIPKNSYAAIGHERRNGYAWYGNWAQSLVEKDYPQWKKQTARYR